MKFKKERRSRLVKARHIIVVSVVLTVAAILAGVVFIHKTYNDNLRPVSNNTTPHVVTVEQNSSPAEIADTLHTKGLIRNDWVFEWYIRRNQIGDELKAGTYVLSQAQSVNEIADTIVKGKVSTDLVTILPGKRLAQIRDGLVASGFSETDVDRALEPSQYEDHPALTDKPTNASLEGYLYPESFQKTAETTPQQVVEQSLDEMQLRLTPNLRQAYSKHGLTLHQAITLASIIEQEVSNPPDRAQAAQVFLKRYKSDMPLGSDPTAFYGAIRDNKEPSVLYDSAYNTRIRKGLPPGPIGNVSEGSLNAVAFPAETDWLYFVSGDDGRTHFSKTLQEHEDLTKKHCTKLCSQ